MVKYTEKLPVEYRFRYLDPFSTDSTVACTLIEMNCRSLDPFLSEKCLKVKKHQFKVQLAAEIFTGGVLVGADS